MQREEALRRLQAAKPYVIATFGIRRLAVFGSTARDQAHAGSDVDIMVSFEGVASAKRYFGLQFYLEDLLGEPVDLVTDKALRPELRPFVEQDLTDV